MTDVMTRAPAKREMLKSALARPPVTAAVDLRDVPEGTPGKVILKNGFSWIRYWVRFDNGVSLGSLDRAVLVTAADLAAAACRPSASAAPTSTP